MGKWTYDLFVGAQITTRTIHICLCVFAVVCVCSFHFAFMLFVVISLVLFNLPLLKIHFKANVQKQNVNNLFFYKYVIYMDQSKLDLLKTHLPCQTKSVSVDLVDWEVVIEETVLYFAINICLNGETQVLDAYSQQHSQKIVDIFSRSSDMYRILRSLCIILNDTCTLPKCSRFQCNNTIIVEVKFLHTNHLHEVNLACDPACTSRQARTSSLYNNTI